MQAHQQQNSNNKSSQPEHQHDIVDIGDSGAQPPRLTKITSTKNTICLPTKIKKQFKIYTNQFKKTHTN